MKNKKLFAILTLVCFMFTLMPVAAFAADPYIWVEDGDEAVKLDENDEAKVKFNLSDVNGAPFYVFAMKDGVLSTKMEDRDGNAGFLYYSGISSNFTATFTAAGEYTVYAVMATDYEDTLVENEGNAKSNTQIAKELIANSDNMVTMYNNVIKVKAVSTNPETSYKAETNLSGHVPTGKTEDFTFTGELTNVIPNNVFEKSVTVTFTDGENVMKGKEVTVETNSAAIEVNKATATTNAAGKVTVKVAASIEGNYEIYFTVDGITWTLKVSVGNTAAAYIETTKAPTAPLAQYAAWDGDEIEFYVTDINGNAVDNFAGMSEIADENENYVVLTEAPADSDLESDELSVVGGTNGIYTLSGVKLDAEGTYAVKVILDNGAYATATWEVKKFQTPVMLIIGASTDVVELGGTLVGELIYVDANGVQKDADDADFTGTGYAAAEADKLAGGNKFVVKAKSDEKYVGAKISTTAVSTKYDLVATKEFKVIDGAAAIAFVDKAADVNVNNKLTWNVVDSTGTRVTLNSYNSVDGLATVEVTDIKYIVLDKPADAKVSVNDASNENDLTTKGIGKMSLTSNKVGNVTVQVVLKATHNDAQDNKQVKYYTGTQIIAVGTQGVGDVVVMSIGSNEIVINDAKATIDAAPIVENNRTFVPFRALAEAFGATVAYDEATQAVTAELNGVTVVMTIGSAEYTVNGEAATMDVAPFINGSRTMVPVRFAAEAFGIKVIPTYDENGATADILFNL